MNMAQKLTILRKEKGLTQMELAEALDVSRQAVSKWELGTALPGTDKLKSIADLYGVSVDYLLDDEQDHYQPTATPVVMPVAVRKGREKLLIALCIGILLVVIALATALVVLVREKQQNANAQSKGDPIKDLTIFEDEKFEEYGKYTFLFE